MGKSSDCSYVQTFISETHIYVIDVTTGFQTAYAIANP